MSDGRILVWEQDGITNYSYVHQSDIERVVLGVLEDVCVQAALCEKRDPAATWLTRSWLRAYLDQRMGVLIPGSEVNFAVTVEDADQTVTDMREGTPTSPDLVAAARRVKDAVDILYRQLGPAAPNDIAAQDARGRVLNRLQELQEALEGRGAD